MGNHGKILVVEDEVNLAETLVDLLKRERFEIVLARDGEEAREAFRREKFDLALLAVGLPDTTGFVLAKELRDSSPGTALIFLTAFSNPEDRIKGLELGAEDYIGK